MIIISRKLIPPILLISVNHAHYVDAAACSSHTLQVFQTGGNLVAKSIVNREVKTLIEEAGTPGSKREN